MLIIKIRRHHRQTLLICQTKKVMFFNTTFFDKNYSATPMLPLSASAELL